MYNSMVQMLCKILLWLQNWCFMSWKDETTNPIWLYVWSQSKNFESLKHWWYKKIYTSFHFGAYYMSDRLQCLRCVEKFRAIFIFSLKIFVGVHRVHITVLKHNLKLHKVLFFHVSANPVIVSSILKFRKSA